MFFLSKNKKFSCILSKKTWSSSKKIAKPPNYGNFSFFLSESEKFSCFLLEKTPPFSKQNRDTFPHRPPPSMLATSRDLSPQLLILLKPLILKGVPEVPKRFWNSSFSHPIKAKCSKLWQIIVHNLCYIWMRTCNKTIMHYFFNFPVFRVCKMPISRLRQMIKSWIFLKRCAVKSSIKIVIRNLYRLVLMVSTILKMKNLHSSTASHYIVRNKKMLGRPFRFPIGIFSYSFS